MSKISVLIVGATGSTGKSIADALLREPVFRVIAAVRGPSLSKPEVTGLRTRGAEIREIDLETATEEQLITLLMDIDIVISTAAYNTLQLQYPLIDAAKKAGVKRFIPSDWSPACIRGIREMHDEKLDIHDYIIKSGLGYTFIDAAYWFNLPPVNPPSDLPSAYELSKHIFGSGDVKFTMIHLPDIGVFVSRILQDPRTINRYVYCYSEEVTQNEVFALARRISGKGFKPVRVSEGEIQELLKKTDGFEFAIWDYVLSIWIRGDSTIENAKKAEYGGAVDAKVLYPDVKLYSLEEFAKDFYKA